MSQNTSINGVRYDFTTISLAGSTAPNFGSIGFQFAKGVLQSIGYDAQQDSGWVQGNQISPVGRTNGFGTGSGAMELLVSEFDDFAALVTANGQTPLMSVFFSLRVGYAVNQIDVRTDLLQGIKITKVGGSMQKGNDTIVVPCDLSIAQIYRNGIAMYGDPVV